MQSTVTLTVGYVHWIKSPQGVPDQVDLKLCDYRGKAAHHFKRVSLNARELIKDVPPLA